MNISELIKRNFVDKNLYMANRVSNVQVVETSNFVKVNSQLCSDNFNVGIILDEHRDYELLFKEVVGSFNEERNVMSLWCWEESRGFQDFLVYKGMRRTEVNFGMYADVKTLDPKIGHVLGFQMFETIDIDAFCQVLSSVFDEEESRNVRQHRHIRYSHFERDARTWIWNRNVRLHPQRNQDKLHGNVCASGL